MPHALITGGAGFIGSHLCAALCQRGWSVTVVDNLVTGSLDNLRDYPGIRFIERDVNAGETWKALAGEAFDVIFHYAALVGVRRTEEQPLDVLDDVQGLRHLAEFVQRGGAQRVVYASSSEVYGPAMVGPMAEHTGVMAWSPYTTIKLYGEYLLQALWRLHGIPTVSLRFFNVYGPGQLDSAYGFVVALFVRQALSGEQLTIFGDGEQTRDFVYVGDNVRAALAAAEHSEAAGHVVNVGTGQETTIRGLAYQVAAAAGREDEAAMVFLPSRSGEVRRRRAATQRMQQLLGFTCTTPLPVGLERLVAAERIRMAVPRVTAQAGIA